ncbi:MAG: TonB-dependent receptor [Bacteroidales bacterium]|nr:TonB-dependent receptor [Bacteroidales bacterium]
MKSIFKRLSLSLLAALFVVSAYAQVTTSSMSGKVTDASGPVAGVAVVAIHQPTGSQFYAITDAGGRYYINNIVAGGPYKVTFTCLGYTDVNYTDVNVALSDNFVINAEMSEQSLSLDAAVVAVESTTSNMRSDRAGALTALDSKQMMKVPTVNRSMNDILKQTPQAYVSGTKTFIGGGSYRDSYVTVDGAAMNNAFGIGSNLPAGGSPISLDALDQMAISITPFDVRQSGFTGGGINATTKSGTNKLEATVYGSFQNQDMQGYQVADLKKINKTDSRYMIYGASVGGPIIKDKLFFFFNVEADRSIAPGPTGMLSERTVDASGKLQDVAGKVFTNGDDRIAYPSYVVMDALHDYMVDNYNYNPGAYLGYNTETPSLKLLGRLDWNINKNHRFNIRYNMVNSKYASAPSTSRTGFADSGYSTTKCTSWYAQYFQNARFYQEQNFSSIAGELNSRFWDGKIANTLRVAYSHQFEPRSTDGGYFPFVDLVVNDVNGDGKNHIYTTFGYEAFSYGNLRDVTTLTATDEVNISLGKHSVLAGISYETDETKNGFQRMGAGAYVFEFADEQAIYDAIQNKTLFAKPSQFAITHGNNATFAQEYPHFTFNQFAFYLQDNYNVNDNLKLTAGVRFEMPVYPSLDFNRNTRVEEATFASTVSNPSGKYSTVDTPEARLTVSPRIGFNWDVFGNRKVVVRGGTGVFVGRIPFVWIVGQSGDAGVLQTTVTKKDTGIPAISNDRNAILKQLYPSGYNASAAGLNLTSITLMDPKLKNPTTWKSSLAVDFLLPGDIKASVEGILKEDIHVVTLSNIGMKAPTTLISVPDIAARPYYNNGRYDSQITDAYLINNVSGLGKAGNYKSVTFKLEKNNWHGLSANASYTYSHARVIIDGVGDQPGSAWKGIISKYGTNHPELGYASYVMPHRVIANVSYSRDYAKMFGTTVSLSYYGGPTTRANIDYVQNVFGDGAYNYSLIDIPTEDQLASWTFKDFKDKENNVTYSADDQKKDFWNYIQQDPYLRTHTGQIAERNSLVAPWVHKFDLKVNQNFYVNAAGHKHTIQLGVDIMNVGNLLNPAWGNVWKTNADDGYGNAIPIDLTNASAVYTTGVKPVFQFQKDGSEILKNTFSISNSLASTWEMIFSLRYIF